MKACFFLKPVIDRRPLKWGRQEVVRHVHYIVISSDEFSAVERPAKFEDAVDFPRQFALYRRRLKGPAAGKRRK